MRVKKDPKVKRPAKLPRVTRNVFLSTFVGIQHPDNKPPHYHPPKETPPITDFLFQWVLPPPVNRFDQTIYRYHRLWTDAVNEIEHGFSNEAYQASYVEGYFWSPMEKRRFFAALDKCGPHDPAAIQQRVGPSKTVYQVQLYISLLQEASEDHPTPEGMPRVDDNSNVPPFAYEMSSAWIAFEEQLAHYLSVILDNESISLDYYHRSTSKPPPPSNVTHSQSALEQEVHAAQELINPLPLYEYAASNSVDGMAPPIMTLETQTVFYRLVRKFVAEVMTGVILNRRRQRHRRQNTLPDDSSAKLEMADDFDIGEADIEDALCNYWNRYDDIDMNVSTTTTYEAADLIDDSLLDDDGQGLGFVIGEGPDDGSSLGSDADDDNNDDRDQGIDDLGDVAMSDDSDGSVYEDSDDGSEYQDSDNGSMYGTSSSDSDHDRMDPHHRLGDNHTVDIMEQSWGDDIRMQQEDCAYEQGLYHHITF